MSKLKLKSRSTGVSRSKAEAAAFLLKILAKINGATPEKNPMIFPLACFWRARFVSFWRDHEFSRK